MANNAPGIQFSKDSNNNLVSLKSPSGGSIPLIGSAKKIAVIGDSVVELTEYLGLSFGQPTNIMSGNVISVPRGSLTCPDGNGSLRWTAAAKTLEWAAPGETYGTPVVVKDGIFKLPSSVPDHYLRISVTQTNLSPTDKVDIIASNPAQRHWRYQTASFQAVADVFTKGRFIWMDNYGIGSNTSAHVLNRKEQPVEDGADIIILRIGGNDVVGAGSTMSVAQSVSNVATLMDYYLNQGKQVLVVLMTARDSGAAYTTAKRQALFSANAGYLTEARKRKGVYVVDMYTPSVDASTGYAKTGYLTDGIHWTSSNGYEAGMIIARILNTLCPDDNFQQNIGVGSYYDPVNYPQGNLLPSNQGAFAGTGGTLQAGITAGTGLGAGLNASKGGPAGMAAIANKVPATDGGPDWQEFVISGADTDGNFIKVFFGNPTLPNPGDLVTMKFDFEVNGAGCYGLFMDCIFTTTGFSIIWDANQMSSITQGIRPGVGSGTGTISMKPIVWPSGVTAITPRIFIQSKAGASFSVKLRNADLRKVI